MVWAPDGGKGHLQNWISGDSQTTDFQTCHNWIMKIETSNEVWKTIFIGRKNKQAFNAFDPKLVKSQQLPVWAVR